MSYYHSLVPFTWMVLFKTTGVKLTGFKTGWSVRRQAEEEEKRWRELKKNAVVILNLLSFPSRSPLWRCQNISPISIQSSFHPFLFLQLPKCHSTQWLKSAITFFWIAVFSHLSSMHKPAGNETSLRNPSLNRFFCFGHSDGPIFCPAYIP